MTGHHFLDLRFLVRAERFRRLLVPRQDFLARSIRRLRTASSAAASTIAAFSRAMIAGGVRLGTQSPCQTAM
jgi:hypothetical protein